MREFISETMDSALLQRLLNAKVVTPSVEWAFSVVCDANEEQGGRNVSYLWNEEADLLQLDFIDPDGDPCFVCFSTSDRDGNARMP